MDIVSKAQRSKNMSAIKCKNTKPELLVRKFLYRNGLRYRINCKITGKPDIVFIKNKIAIFIHGCFWHLHNCKYSNFPKSNSEFWRNKLIENKKRDSQVERTLENQGWKVYIIWECNLKEKKDITLNKLLGFINA